MNEDEKQILALYRDLSDSDRDTLIAFAEFLLSRTGEIDRQTTSLDRPRDIARPVEESVVSAMRRLRDTYHMLDVEHLLHQAAGLLAEHTMQGRGAEEVIDELEKLFADQYERIQRELENS